jgi:ribosomal protein L25 (general stress protein Ctc)
MSELITVDGKLRTKAGKSNNKKIRSSGRIPGSLQEKNTSTMIELDPKWLGKIYSTPGRSFILNLDGKQSTVKITEVQVDKLKRTPIHVDLVASK